MMILFGAAAATMLSRKRLARKQAKA